LHRNLPKKETILTIDKTSKTDAVDLTEEDLDEVHGGGNQKFSSQVASARDTASSLSTGKRDNNPNGDTAVVKGGTVFDLGADFSP